MAFNGSGTFLINTAGQPVVSGTVISSTAFNALTADLATGLSTAITKDGQTTVTANIPMSTYKFTGLGVGSAATDSANLSQVQSTVTKLLNSVSGADTITATASPTLAAYAAGQMFYFVAAGDNTTSVTLNIDSLGAKAVTRDGSTALVAADIKSGEVIVVVYDGTRFQVVSQLNSAGDARFANVSIASSLYVGGVSTFVGNAGFSANVSIASALSVGGVAAITGATTIGGNLTLSGGTANGVLYLNGSKVATSGAALTFDGAAFNVSSSGLPISTFTSSGVTTALVLNNTNANGWGSNLAIQTGGTPAGYFGTIGSLLGNTTQDLAVYANTGNGFRVYTNGNNLRATFDSSGNLGIGTASPVTKLNVASAAGSPTGVSVGGIRVYETTNNYGLNIGGDGTYGYIQGVRGTTSTTGYNDLVLQPNSGNLGLGVTPSAWSSTLVKAIQIADNGCSVSSFTTGNTSNKILNFNNNAYYDAGGWKYVASSVATSRYELTNGEQRWYTAPSGTAGNAISFTQAMTLNASGNLGIGSTASPSGRLSVFGSAASSIELTIDTNATSGRIQTYSSSPLHLNALGNEVLVGGTTDNGAYNLQCNGTGVWGAGAYVNGSDARLKDNIQSLDSGLDVVKAIRPVTFQYKPEYSKDQSVQPGFIAQELQAAMAGKSYLEGVVQSGPEHLNVAYQNIIPILVKAIQELSVKVTALESK